MSPELDMVLTVVTTSFYHSTSTQVSQADLRYAVTTTTNDTSPHLMIPHLIVTNFVNLMSM